MVRRPAFPKLVFTSGMFIPTRQMANSTCAVPALRRCRAALTAVGRLTGPAERSAARRWHLTSDGSDLVTPLVSSHVCRFASALGGHGPPAAATHATVAASLSSPS